MFCRDERTKRVRAVYAPLKKFVAQLTTHTPPPPPPPPLIPLLFLSPLPSPTFFIHSKENNRLPFDMKFFANLHDYRLRSKIGKIQLRIGKNIMHTVTALNKRKKGKQPDNNCNIGFAEVDKKTRPLDETPKSNVCTIRTRIWQTTQGKS